jgi:[ribosomal protein S18]-alanine N-acetyltransferase
MRGFWRQPLQSTIVNRESTMVRSFADADLAAIYAIQRNCPQAAQWRAEDYLRLAGEDGGVILVAEIAGANEREIAGFAAFYRVGEEAELRNLAVDPAQQRKGIARALLAEAFLRMRELGVRRFFLEVRALNQTALALYGSLGFRLLYTRRNYYQDPADNGLVMGCDIENFSPAGKINGGGVFRA